MNKMVTVATAKAGKTIEAIAALKALVDYGRTKYGYKGEAYLQILGGTLGTIYTIAEFDDAASYQALVAKVMKDEGYLALARKAAELTTSPPTLAFLQPV